MANAGDVLAEQIPVAGEEAIFDFGAEHVAEDAPEVFMARVGEERARIGEHAHKAREEAEIAQGVELPFHAFFLIEEPPPGTKLNLAGDRPVVEVADERGEDVIIGGVEIVNNGLGKFVGAFEAVKEATQRFRLVPVTDGVKARITTEARHLVGTVIPQGTKVQLLHPTPGGVQLSEENHEPSGDFFFFAGGQFFSGAGAQEELLDFFLGGTNGRTIGKSVIRNAGPIFMEEGVPFPQAFQKFAPLPSIATCYFAEPVHPGIPSGCRTQLHGFIGTEGGQDAGGPSVSGDLAVRGQIIEGIIGRADHLDPEFFENTAHVKIGFLQAGTTAFPDGSGGAGIENVVNIEIPGEFEMSPVVEGIAKGPGNRPRPRLKFVIRGCRSRAVFLSHPIAAHGPPFVVVPLEPNLEEIGEAAIAGNIGGRQMAVIINDRQILREFVIQASGGLGLQQEVFVYERSAHRWSRPLPQSPPPVDTKRIRRSTVGDFLRLRSSFSRRKRGFEDFLPEGDGLQCPLSCTGK